MKFYYFCKYACMEACQDMKQKSWINAPIHIYELGGAVSPEFSYRITAKQQSFTMVVRKITSNIWNGTVTDSVNELR